METSFSIYNSNNESEFSSDPEQEDYFELNENFTHLTKLIRMQYFAYLKRIINQNYIEWKDSHPEINPQIISDEHVEKCAAQFEERAVRYCMVVQLYRKYMLRIITEIRRETTSHKLISKLRKYPLKSEAKREDLISHIKNEQIDKSHNFPKVGYKRKLENGNKFCPETQSIQVVINGHIASKCEPSKPITEALPTPERLTMASEMEAHENGYIESDMNVSHTEEVSNTLSDYSSLVPYQSGDDSSQQSDTHVAQACPDTRHSRDGSVKAEVNAYESLSLQEKIQKFEATIMARETTPLQDVPTSNKTRKRLRLPQPVHFTHKKLSISQPISPISTSSEEDSRQESTEDTIAKDLENLFAEDDKKNEIEDIFGDGSYNPEIELILRAIENSKVPGESDPKSTNSTKPKAKHSSSAGTDKRRKRYKLVPLTCDLRQSLWPCELHMWTQRLREILGQLADVNIRQHDIVRNRFEELFGEDSEDEFAPYSPSVELNEVLVASCMKRIAPVIVKYLMPPLKEGLIANRYIFKKLAKKIAYNIVLVDQYADEEFIKEQIYGFFCAGRRVENLMDVESI